jgi:hypothetical protein
MVVVESIKFTRGNPGSFHRYTKDGVKIFTEERGALTLERSILMLYLRRVLMLNKETCT